MPLDPFFDERLRVHRKYLFDQALGTMRARLATLGRFWRRPPLRCRRPRRRRDAPADPAAPLRSGRGHAPGRGTAAQRWRGIAAS